MEGSGRENYQWKVLRGKMNFVFWFSLRCRLLEGSGS